MNDSNLSYDELTQQFLERVRSCYSVGTQIKTQDVREGVWQSFERGGRPGRDEILENKNISKRCVVRYYDEDRVARYYFDREQWICCVRGVVLQDIKYFMQIPELVED